MDVAIHSPSLVNALGHLAGVIAFAAFLVLLRRGARLGGTARLSPPAAAATLALLWNVGSLAVLLSAGRTREMVASLSFAVLSMLPGVLLHLALVDRLPHLRAAGYLAAGAAAALHLAEAIGVEVGSHELALDLITYGFGGVAAFFVFLLLLRRTDERRTAVRGSVAISLFLLAASFVHFEAEPGPASWTHELIFHHAAIPLALFVLLQDHRFLLLDAFVRWLGAALLAGGLAAAFAWPASGLGGDAGALDLALWGTALTAGILLYPRLRDRIGQWIEPLLFPRGDALAAAEDLRTLGDAGQESFLADSSRLIAQFVSARRWSLSDSEEAAPVVPVEAFDSRGRAAEPWAEVAVALRVSPGRSRLLLLGPREGGRRYLSADLEDLNRLAEAAAARLDALRRDEQRRLLGQAELQALRAQINPHFLFNALNALYAAIPRSASAARETLLDLSEILRYSLDGKRQYVRLEEELRVVEAYLAVERLRLGDRLTVKLDCDDSARSIRIPAFTIQPLVENAVKHGVSSRPNGGRVDVDVRTLDGRLSVSVADDGGGFPEEISPRSGHGLQNVRRRLELCYGEDASFTIDSSADGARVEFQAPAEPHS